MAQQRKTPYHHKEFAHSVCMSDVCIIDVIFFIREKLQMNNQASTIVTVNLYGCRQTAIEEDGAV